MLAASTFMLVFRIVHIVSGVFWAGSAALFALFIGPAASDVGPQAGPLMANLVRKRHLVTVITTTAALTVIGGLVVYWHDWHEFASFGDWIGSRFGRVLTIGGVAAIAAFFEGWHGVGRGVERLVDLGEEIASAEGPPAPERLAAFQEQQERIKTASIVDLVLLLIAVLAMATARYW